MPGRTCRGRLRFGGLLLALLAHAAGAGAEDAGRPSFLLFVMDTTRADSVSAYGAVRATTPAFDALAASGVRYARAYANASWTLPSHATIFTGLLPHQHAVDWSRIHAADELVMLAERMRAAGYQTVGFAENEWLSDPFNLNQGFEHFEMVGVLRQPFREALRRWLPERDPGRPLFLFVNVIDSHGPYEVRDVNPFLPAGVTVERAAAVPQGARHYMCRTDAFQANLSILRGLYLGDVAAADAKLARTRDALRTVLLGGDRLVTIATSDHGEHFGENEFAGHQTGLREALIHVPLVVHDPGRVAPGVVEAPVQLAAITPTVLKLAGLPIPAGLFAPPLPLTANEAPSDAPIVAEWTDPGTVDDPDAPAEIRKLRNLSSTERRACRPKHRAYGSRRALVEYPYQLIRLEGRKPILLDLRSSQAKRRNLRKRRPDQTESLLETLAETRTAPVVDTRERAPVAPLPQEAVDQLRALGYLEPETP